MLPGCSCGSNAWGSFPYFIGMRIASGSSDQVSGPKEGDSDGRPSTALRAGLPVVSAQLQNVCPLPINFMGSSAAKEEKEKVNKTRGLSEAVVDDGSSLACSSGGIVGSSTQSMGGDLASRKAEGALGLTGSSESDASLS